MSEPHALDQLRQHWTQASPAPDRPGRTSLSAQLRAFQADHSPRNHAAAMIAMGIFGLLFAVLWGSRLDTPEPLPHFGLLALIAWAAAAWRGLEFYWMRRLRQVAPLSQYAYLKRLQRQLRRKRWAQRGLMGMLLAYGLVFLWHTPLPEDTLTQVALGAFLVVCLFLMAVLTWWYRHHHPYRLPEMEQEISALLAEYEAEGPEV